MLKTLLIRFILVGVVVGLGWQIYLRLGEESKTKQRGGKTPLAVAVETVPIQRQTIAQARTFSGTLEARAEFVAAPKIGGRLEQLTVDLADTVRRGEVVAVLDSAEYEQAVAQAEADLAVAQANVSEARSLLRLAERELQRIQTLKQRGVSSAAEQDTAQANQVAKAAHVEVTLAQEARAKAALKAARIQLGYTKVQADWNGGSELRSVALRYVDEGETVAAHTPLLRIVALDPITAVIHVTERDYAGLRVGQAARLQTDAYPEQDFVGEIERIAPVFQENTRQARVEVRVANPEQILKPGLFVRAHVILKQLENATVVPVQALVKREQQTGIFVLADGRDTVSWQPVTVGIRTPKLVQVSGEELQGQVVVLGQQLLDDGSQVLRPQAKQVSP